MLPNFDNTAVAFQLKTDAELKRACFLFKSIANPTLVKVGTTLVNWALRMRLPVKGIIKSTVFDHFCGGVTKKDCLPVIDAMHEKGVFSILDYAVEGKADESQFEDTTQNTLTVIEFAKDKAAVPFVVFKPTGLGQFALYEKVSAGQKLTQNEAKAWQRIEERYNVLCQKGHELGVRLLIDAEESWMQDAADNLALQMMRKYNREKAIVFNTLQTYRHDRVAYLKQVHKTATLEQFKLGFKVVRGAYMEKENKRAAQKGYKSPICVSKQATDANFNTAIAYSMEHLDNIALFAVTHNEESTHALIRQMQ